MGTSLALVGAYVLAGELGAGIDGGIDAVRLAAAPDRYHTVLRPYVDRCRKLPNGIDGYLPKSATDIAITALVMKYMQRWPFRSFAERNGSPPPTPSTCQATRLFPAPDGHRPARRRARHGRRGRRPTGSG
jgi:hypothetical protein